MGDPKLLVALASVFVGWFLAQFTGIAKDWLYRRKVSQSLLEELYELQSELERTSLIYSRQLQIYALQGIDNNMPVPLSNHIFKNYYKDAVLGLNKHQRISIQLIHTFIEVVNTGILEHYELTKSILKNIQEGSEGITAKDGELWGNKVICEYTHVATALWHIKFHLSNQKSPDLSPFTVNHERYLQYLEGVEKEISERIETAKNLDRASFDKTYNPANFTK